MAIPWVPIPEGARVRIKQAPPIPQDPRVLGRAGTVLAASEYRPESIGVVMDGSEEVIYFSPAELEPTSTPALPPDREAAKQRRALP